MKLKLDARYKRSVDLLIWGVGILAVAASLVTLPPVVGLPLALAALLLTGAASRIVYRYTILWIYPGPSPGMDATWIGTCWFKESGGASTPSLALLYERKDAAAEAYCLLRTWVGGKYIDSRRDLRVTLVKESDTKYSTFIYPGDRAWKKAEIADVATSTVKGNIAFSFNVAKPYFHLCRDYREHENMLKLIRSLPELDWLFVNTAYVTDNAIDLFAKKSIKTKLWVTDRTSLNEEDLEFHFKWYDPKNKTPIKYERVKGLEALQRPAG